MKYTFYYAQKELHMGSLEYIFLWPTFLRHLLNFHCLQNHQFTYKWFTKATADLFIFEMSTKSASRLWCKMFMTIHIKPPYKMYEQNKLTQETEDFYTNISVCEHIHSYIKLAHIFNKWPLKYFLLLLGIFLSIPIFIKQECHIVMSLKICVLLNIKQNIFRK